MSDNLHLAWTRLFARGLAASGVREVVISPGSRSTPLVLGLDAEPALRKHVVIDERAAAFFALGQARLTGQPTALLCTSGTAAAHYLPAAAEAALSHIPLIVITADRPWEAYDCAASQTIDQVKLFGDHVRHYAELGLPDLSALPSVMRVAAQAALRSRWPTPGPVHINARFRKPLEPVDAPRPEPHEAIVDRLLRAGPPRLFPPLSPPDPAAIAALVEAIRSCKRGLIVAGPAPTPGAPSAHHAAHALAQALGYPLCAEATSNLRGDELTATGERGDNRQAIGCFEVLFRSPAFLKTHQPDLVIELGMPPVSTAYGAWLASRPDVRRFVLAPHGWNDPHGTAHAMIWGDLAAVLQAVLAALGEPPAADPAWAPSWHQAAQQVEALIAEEFSGHALTEGAVAGMLTRDLQPHSVILIGNSGPVRDLDIYGGSIGGPPPGGSGQQECHEVQVIHQRGAAGIDGLIAGAAGVLSVAEDRTVWLYLGDVSLLHDIGSLNLAVQTAARTEGTLGIVVTNNDGGRIFEQLPLSRRTEVKEAFERYFLTPHGGNFASIARGFGIHYRTVTSQDALAGAIESLDQGVTLIEARVPPEDGARCRASLWRKLNERLEASPPSPLSSSVKRGSQKEAEERSAANSRSAQGKPFS